MIDTLGNRMKKYEAASRLLLPPRTHIIIRCDGKAFHTYAKNVVKPYDQNLADAMDAGAMALCKEMMGCQFAYGQSDEYSFLVTDFSPPDAEGNVDYGTEAWFAGNIQKMVSVASSIFTAQFNLKRLEQLWANDKEGPNDKQVEQACSANFDARIFVIPSRHEVEEYFVWRQLDAVRNSLAMLASCHFSHKVLQGASFQKRRDMLMDKGINWDAESSDFRQGRIVYKAQRERDISYVHKKTGKQHNERINETYWTVDHNTPRFTHGCEHFKKLIPEQI